MTELFRSPFFQAVDINGNPLAGALLYFYATGTTTPISTYQDSGLSTPSTTVLQSDGSFAIVADASGIFAPIYINTDSYKMVLKTAALVTVQTDDPVYALASVSGFHAATAKSPPVAGDEFPILDSADSYKIKKVLWSVILTTIGTAIGSLIAAATGKTTPVDADMLVIADSAASNTTKKLTFANLKVWVGVALGPLINGFTGKTTPVDADTIVISDSAASNVSKKVTWANIKATLLAYLTPLNAPVVLTALGTGSGTTKDFTIPANCNLFYLSMQGVSTNNTSAKLVQLGDSGGMNTSGYVGGGGYYGTTTDAVTNTAGLVIRSILAADTIHGMVIGVRSGTQTWTMIFIGSASTLFMFSSACSITLSGGVLTTVRLTSVTPDTFDAGTVGASYELG